MLFVNRVDAGLHLAQRLRQRDGMQLSGHQLAPMDGKCHERRN
jgi:hypothetical protein